MAKPQIRAKTSQGRPCIAKAMRDGGLSTGSRTEAGKARLREAIQRY